MDLQDIIKQCRSDSTDWFPFEAELVDEITFLLLALSGEVGEACNEWKKGIRGSVDMATAEDKTSEELVDVFIYLLNLFGVLGIDPTEAYLAKRTINERRFGNGAGRHASRAGHPSTGTGGDPR